MTMTLLESLFFIFLGLLAGFINTVASSGTAITLPVMIFFGVDPLVANATNRLPVFVGFLTSVVNYSRSGKIPWKKTLLLSIPIIIGTAIGAIFVQSISGIYSEIFVAIALFISLALILMNPGRFLVSGSLEIKEMDLLTFTIMFLIGIWAGIIVLDSAIFVLFTLVLLMKYDLIQANIIKSVLVLGIGLVSLIVFIYFGKINWELAILLSFGSMIGGYLGSNFAMKETSRIWVFRMIKWIISVELLSFFIKAMF